MRESAPLHLKLSGGMMIATVIMLSALPFVHGVQPHCHVQHQAIFDDPALDGVYHGIHDINCIWTLRSSRFDYYIYSQECTYLVFGEPNHLVVIESCITNPFTLSPSESRAPPIHFT